MASPPLERSVLLCLQISFSSLSSLCTFLLFQTQMYCPSFVCNYSDCYTMYTSQNATWCAASANCQVGKQRHRQILKRVLKCRAYKLYYLVICRSNWTVKRWSGKSNYRVTILFYVLRCCYDDQWHLKWKRNYNISTNVSSYMVTADETDGHVLQCKLQRFLCWSLYEHHSDQLFHGVLQFYWLPQCHLHIHDDANNHRLNTLIFQIISSSLYITVFIILIVLTNYYILFFKSCDRRFTGQLV